MIVLEEKAEYLNVPSHDAVFRREKRPKRKHLFCPATSISFILACEALVFNQFLREGIAGTRQADQTMHVRRSLK